MNISIIKNHKAMATIVIGSRIDTFHLWVAEEIQRYVRQISGVELPIVTVDDAIPEFTTQLLIGSPQSHSWIEQLQQTGQVHFGQLKAEGFILKSLFQGESAVFVVSGLDARGVMYAAYELIERMGVVFQLTKDIIPETQTNLVLPSLDIRYEPAIRHRGFHMRHFVIPWMGYQEFCQMIDQMAKMKCNYLEFYWYEGAPWIEFSHHGEKKLIGDLYSQESGFTSWWVESFAFSTEDVVIGKEHFSHTRPCAIEFQECHTPEQAYRVARTLLNEMIAYAHTRHIEVWLGAGDCPTVPPNLGRSVKNARSAGPFGYVISPGEPSGLEIWSTILESMVDTYPDADGYWLWLAETYFEMGDVESEKVLRQYQGIQHLLPNKEQLIAMGYDQHVKHIDEAEIMQGDLSLIHYGKQVIERVQHTRPHVNLGVSLLGRSYLFPAFHTLLPTNVRLQSMESAVCWNRNSRVPMENFSGKEGREMFLVPRLDDDENEFAMQFNVGLYEHDRVLSASHQYSISGIAPQIGKTRGLEHNARYIAEGCWKPDVSAREFYASYVQRIFGEQAQETMLTAFCLLDEHELFLGLEVDTQATGYTCYQGMGNFFNYIDSRDIGWLKLYRNQEDPEIGMDWITLWGNQKQVDTHFRGLRYRRLRFEDSIVQLNRILDLLENARPSVSVGSQAELAYMIVKTKAFMLHLQTCCAMVQGMIDYEAAHEAKRQGHINTMQQHFSACESAFAQAYALAVETARVSASLIDHPSERHILFRYNVRHVLPLREFQKFISNSVNYHNGQSYRETVNWGIIDPGKYVFILEESD